MKTGPCPHRCAVAYIPWLGGVIRLTGGQRKKRRGGREELEEIMPNKPNQLKEVMPNEPSWLILLVIILAVGSRYLNKKKRKRREGRRERKKEREKKEGKKGRFAFNNYRGRGRIPGPRRIF
jgi:hypothetical protein